jgi:hypothetical protein
MFLYLNKSDITKNIWKRLYHNAPYLLKTKGTERGLRALMSCYGIPSTILNIKEYGGSTTDNTSYKTFSYEKSGLAVKGDSGTNGYFIKTNWSSSLTRNLSSSAKTAEIGIKPHRSTNNYHLWSLSGSYGTNSDRLIDQHLILEPYTGNAISSSGAAAQYGSLTFSTYNQTKAKSTPYFPVYNGDFWNIYIGYESASVIPEIKFGAYQANYLKNVTSEVASVYMTHIEIAATWGMFSYPSHPQFPLEDKLGYNSGATYCYIGGLPPSIDGPYPENGAHSNISGLRYHMKKKLNYHYT